jgi:chemosensory pili system protein ChpA (sensor histidine kinase/response regulator)
MDTEKQIRFNFLDEAQEYFDTIETNLLGLGNKNVDTQQLDLMLRLVHSIKGSAAMMDFPILSRAAHRLEDFFKILRVRYSSLQLNVELESLMLRGLDCLRQISQSYRQGLELDESWLGDFGESIFQQLREQLGELQEADENALMAQDEDVDPALLMFEEGVQLVLDRLEENLPILNVNSLSQELITTAKELIAFAQMANLSAFSELSQSIQQQAQTLPRERLESLAKEALTTWRRSHALVMRGRIEQLPSRLNALEAIDCGQKINAPQTFVELNLDLLDDISLDWGELQEVKAAFAEESVSIKEIDLDFTSSTDIFADLDNLRELQNHFEREISTETPKVTIVEAISVENKIEPPIAETANSLGKMVRVPLEQIKQLNNTFEKLIQERNQLNLYLQQTHQLAALMGQRMQQIEESNQQLKQWYDRAAIAGIFSQRFFPSQPTDLRQEFDALEMDRYSDLHVICQEQIETTVQLQEVSSDIQLGLQQINQTFRSLETTTKSLQNNLTRAQMVPFAEAVKRFPRVIRELSLQFGKEVNLKIEGENTLIDRSILENLTDPLLHLLRNAFDHGIEEPSVRIANSKPYQGTIFVEASKRGTQTVITIRDDGAGISVDKIRNRLFGLGLPSEYIQELSKQQLLDYIFEPGFTTTEKITELSGRGVGMDIVRTNLKQFRGEIQVETEPGVGTTFTLQFPFTLSILRVMVVEDAGILLALPSNSVREILPWQPQLFIQQKNTEKFIWNDRLIPLIRLERYLVFNREGFVPPIGNPNIAKPLALIVGEGERTVAIYLSRFWYEREVTIGPILSPIPLPPGMTTAVSLGNGRLIPLLEPLAAIAEWLNISPTLPGLQAKVISGDLDKTILVVDDSINVRRYLGFTLEKAGYKVEEAKDGREAVEKLINGLSVRAVICDIEMPRLDGYGVLEELKGRSMFKNLPIIMLTSRSNEKHRKLAMNLGASAYFSKPYNEEELLNYLEEYTQKNDN